MSTAEVISAKQWASTSSRPSEEKPTPDSSHVKTQHREPRLGMLGKTIGGRYQIVRHLGGGGFSQTYLAADQHLPGKPLCVVKLLKPRVTDPESLQAARRLFDREAQVLYSLGSHSQIPRLYAHFEENEEFYLVQEYIEGTLISKELKAAKGEDESYVINLLQDILQTLEFVHQQQVIHRDIKPSNLIRRRSDQRVVLIDFGAVKQIGVHQMSETLNQQTSFTIAIGSNGYMPNEQIAGKPRFSSDVYAVGIVGIQALARCKPSQLPEDPRTGEIIWRDRVDVSVELAEVIDTMIRYDFRQRYQTAADALQALQRLSPAPTHEVVILPSVRHHSLEEHLAWMERGDDLFQQQRYRASVECYDKVLQIKPDEYLAWFKRGIALDNLKQYGEAVESYDQVLKLQPEDYLAWFKRGRALEHLEYADEAIASYDKVIELQPDNYWAWHDRGRAMEAAQRYEDAASSYARAVQLKPDFKLAIQSRKRLLSQLKQVDQLYGLQHYEEAIASCEAAIRANPQDPLAWLMRGMAMENLKQYQAAIASYSQVVKLQPDDHLAWFKLGAVLEMVNKPAEALVCYNRVLRIQPDNSWAWHDRGRVLELLQKYDAALSSYDKALQLKPDLTAAIEGRQRALNSLKTDPAVTNVSVATQVQK
ncbi:MULTISPECIES: serine/threonine-protein kinase [unclassified Leptolyngbya]|uniref:serine/threonine-protein kinase n=1 Tax=unclassified Leptolyngbya TaxID=2650499 RepID=UPI0018EF9125|nr:MULTISPECIES: serine/threonine-protein kinase [unclassified Leptolyngbya]